MTVLRASVSTVCSAILFFSRSSPFFFHLLLRNFEKMLVLNIYPPSCWNRMVLKRSYPPPRKMVRVLVLAKLLFQEVASPTAGPSQLQSIIVTIYENVVIMRLLRSTGPEEHKKMRKCYNAMMCQRKNIRIEKQWFKYERWKQ